MNSCLSWGLADNPECSWAASWGGCVAVKNVMSVKEKRMRPNEPFIEALIFRLLESAFEMLLK